MNEQIKLRLFRITVIGACSSGKTCLVNSFVNGVCPQRYIRTDKGVVYYKKVEIDDEGEYDDIRKPIVVEIEDTPGSERGNEDDDDAGAAAKPDAEGFGGPPKIRKGSRVVLLKDKNELVNLINDFKPKGRLKYKPAMDGMLGKEYSVKVVAKDGSYGLPSPDGSEGGVWNFPPGAVKLKVSLTLPIDQYLTLGEKERTVHGTLKDRKKHAADLQHPLLAYERPIGNPDMDKTISKNRMGYFICFDISDETGESLKEAMTVHQMLKKSLNNSKKVSRLKPHIWLIGCKSDRTSSDNTMRQNQDSAQVWSDQEEIPFRITSAKNHKGVQDVFNDMIQQISSRENLWSLDDVDDEEAKGEASAACFSQ